MPTYKVKYHSFAVPLLPPSVNHYKNGGHFLTRESKAYIDALAIFSRKLPVDGDFYEIDIDFHIVEREFLRWDLDNFQKVAIDALTKCDVIRDDRFIVALKLHKQPVDNYRDQRTEYAITGVWK